MNTKKKIINKDKRPSLFQQVYNRPESLNYLNFLYNAPKVIEWKGYPAIPPNSFLDIVSRVFFENTNIPLEIPTYVSLALISGTLLQKRVKIRFANGELVRPDLWIVILSESGSGKTYTLNHLTSIAQVKEFPDCASAARFAQELLKNNNSIWIRDEFGHLLKAIEEQGYLRELKDYLLRIFDGKEVNRTTKQEEISVKNPALSLLGMSVGATFLRNITLDSMLDGFAQRFQYVIARPDSQRHFSDFPIWTVGEHKEQLSRYWEQLWQGIHFEEYIFSSEALLEFKNLFKQNIDPLLPESFYRRVLFRLAKYGLIYHLLLGKKDKHIDAEDISWASRLILIQLEDAKNIIEDYSCTEIEKKVKTVGALSRKIGRIPTPRDLIRHINSIRNVQEAYSLLKISNFTVG